MHSSSTSIQRCDGRTLTGQRCHRVLCNRKFCRAHENQGHPWAKEKPETCPVCCEPFIPEDQPLSCGHWVHRACVVASKSARCPVCRGEVILRKGETKKITEARKKEQRGENDIGTMMERWMGDSSLMEGFWQELRDHPRRIQLSTNDPQLVEEALGELTPLLFYLTFFEYICEYPERFL